MTFANFNNTESIVTLSKNQFDGMELVRDGDGKISIDVGSAKSKSNLFDIEIVTKIQLDLSTGGAGGLDTGSESSSTWYYIHALGKNADTSTGTNTTATANKLIDSAATFIADSVQVGDIVFNTTDTTQAEVSTVDSETQLTLSADIFTGTSKSYIVGPKGIGVFSLSTTSPTLPTGYTDSRRIGSWKNNGSSNFLNGIQYGKDRVRRYIYDETVATTVVLTNGNATSATDVDCSSFMPTVSQIAIFMVAYETGSSGGANDLCRLRPNSIIDTNFPWNFGVGVVSAFKSRRVVEIPTDSSQIIEYKVDNSNNKLTLSVAGFVEEI